MIRKTRVLLYSALIVAVISMVNMHTIVPVRASGTPVFVLGVGPTDSLVTDLQSLTNHVTILSSISGLLVVTPGSILYVDGNWLASASSIDSTVLPALVQVVMTGIPTIVVRGNPNLLASSVSGLMNFQNPGLPLVAEGIQAAGSLLGGVVQGSALRVISGFDYSVSAEFQWASAQLPQTGGSGLLGPLSQRHALGSTITPQDSSSPYWAHVITLSTDTGTYFMPYGEVITTFTVYELQNSGSSSYKWFNTFSNQTFIPGYQAFNSNWRNYVANASAVPVDQGTNLFVAHGPGSLNTSGGTTVSYAIGTQQGALNANVSSTQTMSYFLKNTMIADTSSYPTVDWTHTIVGNTAAGKLTLQVVPGWTDEVVQSASLNVQGNTAVTFATFNGNSVTGTQATTVQFTMNGG